MTEERQRFTRVKGELETSDIEIGAVEIKDGSTDARASLGAHGSLVVEGVASGVAVPVSGPLTDTQLRATPVPVKSPDISVAADIAGTVVVTTAGTPVAGPDVALTNGAWLTPRTTNTGIIYVGNHATDMRTDYAYPLAVGQQILVQVTNLNQLKFDASVSGEKIAWLKA